MRLSDSLNHYQPTNASSGDHAALGQYAAIAVNAQIRSQATADWRSQLLPLSVVQQEDDVAVLREQLEAAHRLLQQQQVTIEGVQGQLGSCQTQLTQVAQDLEDSQKQYTHQSAKIEDVKSVCHDLRAQLQRQQTRIGEYQQAIQQLDEQSLSFPQASSAGPAGVVALRYGVFAKTRAEGATKTSPVKTWSANEEARDLSSSFALYRKLAAMTVAAASHHSRVAKRYGQRLRRPLKSANTMVSQNLNASQATMQPRVELPSFI